MTSPPWSLDRHRAQLSLGPLSASIDLLRPETGLGSLLLGSDQLPDAGLLALNLRGGAAGAPTDAILLQEHHVCGRRLVADYGESPSRPVRVRATWRAHEPSPSGGVLALVELVVSVETDLLDSRPELSASSQLCAASVLRLTDPAACRYEALAAGSPASLLPEAGPSCVVLRPPGLGWSYAEMLHPLDFAEDRLEKHAGPAPIVRLRHRLFCRSLEKGVLLRARICGLLLPRDVDTQLAAESYRRFAAAEPPLGT